MDVAAIDQAITDHAASLLLRYFNAPEAARAARPAVSIERDRELLRLHWALSPAVTDLVAYILSHRHEIQSVLGTARRVEDGIVRGRLDAVGTLRARRMSGLATAVVSHEPLRSYDSGPNQVLGWVISQAWSLASRFVSLVVESSAYRARLDEMTQRLEQVRRIDAVRQIASQATLGQRPKANALLEAERSRRTMYHKAATAFRALLLIESGDPEAIVTMLRHTLLAPLEPWRRYELAVAYSLAETLADRQGTAMILNFIVGDIRVPIAQAGRCAVYWQWRTKHYAPPPLEPSEQVSQAIWATYGLGAAPDRPDLVVVDSVAATVLAIVEVKYLTGESAADRVRSAVTQLVRYARGYGPLAGIEPLLGRCLIAVSQGLGGIAPVDPRPAGTPSLVDFAGIQSRALDRWADELLS